MGIFSRKRQGDPEGSDLGTDADLDAADSDRSGDSGDSGGSDGSGDTVDSASDDLETSADDALLDEEFELEQDVVEERFSRARGPFDVSEVDEDGPGGDRLDLGALRIQPIDGMQLRLELDEEQQTVLSAHALIGNSGVQLQAFAAPRTLGVWPDIRAEIAESITSQGGTSEIVDGPLGRELVARIPSRGPDGRTVQNPVRFLGVDGPRWFLRAVINGAAAVDERKAAPLVELVRTTVVVRDDQARPPREVLPLQVPSQPEAPADESVDGVENEDEVPRSTADLRPFERGPEITEVR